MVLRKIIPFSGHLHNPAKAHWEYVKKLLQNLYEAMHVQQLEETLVVSQLESMAAGDVVTYLIHAHNATVVFRRGAGETITESFEVSPTVVAVMGACSKLVCLYPGPVIAIPDVVFDDTVFCLKLAHFLCEMDKDSLDAVPTSCKLLTGILQAVGRPAKVQQINKHIGDDVVWRDACLPWHRSLLWLVIRVILQTTLVFMLFFMNGLAREAMDCGMSDDILHWVSTKISHQLMKLGESAPDWLSDSMLQTSCHFCDQQPPMW
ncbi:hypothetical protein EV401DRAFT_2060158 [Pisolithus croceorrhizus]|nr:hypothetical protein EV401DRAFT_2060158 [Pisolithus croceorrhizus]